VSNKRSVNVIGYSQNILKNNLDFKTARNLSVLFLFVKLSPEH